MRNSQMTVDTTPKFTIADAARLAREVYRLDAAASPLPSERDQNFLLKTRSGEKFVLKIAKSDEERGVLELQNAVLKHVAQRAPRLALQCLVATPSGEDLVPIESSSGQPYFMRMMGWLEGEVLVRAQPHSRELLESLGSAMAELDLALQDFVHPAMHRALHWDVKRADLALRHVPLLSAEQRSTVQQLMTGWAAIDWSRLRHSVIHGDANDYNVLVRGDRVAGLLDFGDMVHSAVACELAIALAYAMLDKTDPMNALIPVVSACQAGFPLTRTELEALPSLVAARLCMSVCYAAHNAMTKSEDAYQQVTAAPAWNLLQQLADMPQQDIQTAVFSACRIS